MKIESVMVVTRGDDGKLEIRKPPIQHWSRFGLGCRRRRGTGVIFPPSIIGSALVLGAAGAATGKLRELHHRSELANELEDAIAPGHSGITALVSRIRES